MLLLNLQLHLSMQVIVVVWHIKRCCGDNIQCFQPRQVPLDAGESIQQGILQKQNEGECEWMGKCAKELLPLN